MGKESSAPAFSHLGIDGLRAAPIPRDTNKCTFYALLLTLCTFIDYMKTLLNLVVFIIMGLYNSV